MNNALPRQPANAGHVAVQMKRKLEYKNNVHCASYVNPELLLQSLNHFKEKGHPSYQEITFVASYEPIVQFDPEPEGEEHDNATKKNTEHSKNDKKSGSSPNDQVIAFKIKTLILIC